MTSAIAITILMSAIIILMVASGVRSIEACLSNLVKFVVNSDKESLQRYQYLRGDLIEMFNKIPLAEAMEREIRSMCESDCTTDEILDYLDRLDLATNKEE